MYNGLSRNSGSASKNATGYSDALIRFSIAHPDRSGAWSFWFVQAVGPRGGHHGGRRADVPQTQLGCPKTWE